MFHCDDLLRENVECGVWSVELRGASRRIYNAAVFDGSLAYPLKLFAVNHGLLYEPYDIILGA